MLLHIVQQAIGVVLWKFNGFPLLQIASRLKQQSLSEALEQRLLPTAISVMFAPAKKTAAAGAKSIRAKAAPGGKHGAVPVKTEAS